MDEKLNVVSTMKSYKGQKIYDKRSGSLIKGIADAKDSGIE